MDWMEIFALVTGAAYVVLEIKQKNFMWVVGVITALASMYVFFSGRLYASFCLNLYYFVISFWGLYCWRKDALALRKVENDACVLRNADKSLRKDESSGTDAGGETEAQTGFEIAEAEIGTDAIHLNRLDSKVIWISVAVTLIGTLALMWLLSLTGDPMSWLDAGVAVLSAVATYWLGKSYLEQWLLWIVADSLSIVLCLTQGMWWMSLMYIIYAAAAVYGYFHWKRLGKYLA